MVVPLYAVGFIYIPGNTVLCFLSLCSCIISANNRVHYWSYSLVCTLHYRIIIIMYLKVLNFWNTCQVHSVEIVSNIRPIISINSLVMVLGIRVLYLIIIIKSEVWTICHCLGLSHETMACAVFLCSYDDVMAWKHFPHHPPFVERFHQLSVDTPKTLTLSGALGFPLWSSSRSTWTNSRVVSDMSRDVTYKTSL